MSRQQFDNLSPARFDVLRPATGRASSSIATLAGYAIVWNTLSSDRGGHLVRLLPDSASFAPATLALYGHNYQDVLGNRANGTLRLQSDARGVRVEIDLPNTSVARDVLELVRRGDVGGMSFGMASSAGTVMRVVDGVNVLDVPSFTLDEVTITAVPAFELTSIGVQREAVAKSDGYAMTGKAGPPSLSLRLARARLDAHRLLPG